MLEVLTKNGWQMIENRKGYCTTYEYDGTQVLSFDLSPDDEIYQYIANEVPVRNSENRYLIKSIDKRKSSCTVTCEIDMDDWFQKQPYLNTKDVDEFKSKTLLSILNTIKPNGWTVINAGIRSIKRTIELENATGYDILMKCQEVFEVVYGINNIDKQIIIVDPDTVTDRNIYITPQLNLSGMTLKGTSDGFATRITAYGKQNEDGSHVNFASINNGKTYVEDNTYANKAHPIWVVWKDERYTIPENLLKAARKKLKEQAFPALSFEVTVNDLAESDDRYSFLRMGLYDYVHVIIDSNIEIIERVIKFQRFHDAPEKNKITLSNKPETITGRLNQAISVAAENLSSAKESILEQAKKKATELINTWAEKGHVYMTENEIYILDKIPKENAKFCIRINLGGIGFSQNGWQGPYISAWTIDGAFNADFITAGTIRGLLIEGSESVGGKITGETTIEVGTDLHVGNDVYLGNQEANEFKTIHLNKDTFITLSDYGLYFYRGDSRLFLSETTAYIRVGNDFFPIAADKNDKSIWLGGSVSTNNLKVKEALEVEGTSTLKDNLNVWGDVMISGSLGVVGNKNRTVPTENYGVRKLNAVESASCYFTDEGQITIGSDGKATIHFDPIWLETVNTEKQYHMQLTPYCAVCPWIIDEHKDYCIIGGKPNTKVNWHVSALQKEYENVRLEEFEEKLRR